MKRALLLIAALLLGGAAGEWGAGNFAFRSALGRFVRHDQLVQLVGRRGIYARDPLESGRSLEQLVADAKITNAAARETIAPAAIDRGLELLRAPLPNEKAWDALLARAHLSTRALRASVAENLRGRQWLEARVAAFPPPNEQEIQRAYDAARPAFLQPQRFRVSHLFLAAPDGYPDEVIAAKRQLIDELALRLQRGESFDELVSQFSEDEETKNRGGDLNYFSADRMLPEIFAAAQSLRVGQTSAPIRSRLGFHLLQLTEALPSREMTLPEATPEIVAALANAHRAAVLAQIRSQP